MFQMGALQAFRTLTGSLFKLQLPVLRNAITFEVKVQNRGAGYRCLDMNVSG